MIKLIISNDDIRSVYVDNGATMNIIYSKLFLKVRRRPLKPPVLCTFVDFCLMRGIARKNHPSAHESGRSHQVTHFHGDLLYGQRSLSL